jgi:hypothetical protein
LTCHLDWFHLRRAEPLEDVVFISVQIAQLKMNLSERPC